jgi:hypothetical protein
MASGESKKFDPKIVTTVPPTLGPEFGKMVYKVVGSFGSTGWL